MYRGLRCLKRRYNFKYKKSNRFPKDKNFEFRQQSVPVFCFTPEKGEERFSFIDTEQDL